jgi:hypothetical protein
MLASRLTRHIDVLHQALQPPGSRPPFTTILSEAKTLDLFLHNPQAKAAVMARLDLKEQVELENALSLYIRKLMPGGPPQMQGPPGGG